MIRQLFSLLIYVVGRQTDLFQSASGCFCLKASKSAMLPWHTRPHKTSNPPSSFDHGSAPFSRSSSAVSSESSL
ncbi:hypothetical protein BDV18DRAFT_128067, partial [Aspergillus unguis]